MDKELTLGFVTPPGSGYKVPTDQPNIENFKVVLNGQPCDFSVVKFKSDKKSPATKYAEEGDFVYLFKGLFMNGVKQLHHSYTFHGRTDGANCYSEIKFPYRLLILLESLALRPIFIVAMIYRETDFRLPRRMQSFRPIDRQSVKFPGN